MRLYVLMPRRQQKPSRHRRLERFEVSGVCRTVGVEGTGATAVGTGSEAGLFAGMSGSGSRYSKNSDVLRITFPAATPPATSTRPSESEVAMWKVRATDMMSVMTTPSSGGSKICARPTTASPGPMPPARSTRPSGKSEDEWVARGIVF